MAIVSLVVGILSWFILPFVGGIIAVFSGIVARKEIKTSGGQFTGDGMAIAGLVLGYSNIAVYALVFLCILASFIMILPAGLLNQ